MLSDTSELQQMGGRVIQANETLANSTRKQDKATRELFLLQKQDEMVAGGVRKLETEVEAQSKIYAKAKEECVHIFVLDICEE